MNVRLAGTSHRAAAPAWIRRIAGVSLVGLLAVAPVAILGAAAANAEHGNGTDACVTSVYYSTPSRSTGFKGTTETSYQVAGPGTISYTETATATQTFGVTASVSISANAIIAKASATFGTSYAYSTASSRAWGYSTSIPAGKTGLMAVLHRDDRVSTVKYTEQPNCTRISSTFYSYIPRAAKASTDYCIIRDLYPYGYANWRSSCTGE